MPIRLALLLFVLVMGCDAASPVEQAPLLSFDAPVISGVRLVDDLGHPLGVYGNPERSPVVPISEIACSGSPGSEYAGESLRLLPVSPNPVRWATTARYVLPCRADAEFWVVKGVLPGEQAVTPSQIGAVVVSPPRSRLVSRQQGVGPGQYAATIDADALQLPDGFYRLYLRFGGALTWTDLWINRSHSYP